VQKLVQLVYAGRGVLIAMALVVIAVPAAKLYGAPKLEGGLVWLALSPLILGFMHLDVRRTQRDHDFRPQAICMIASDCAGLIAASAAAWLVRDFSAILYGLIARAIVMTGVSHVVAKRRYGWAWDADHGPRLTRFAAPLLLNGVIIFLTAQGDRVFVGKMFGATALGLYSSTILLIYYPAVLLANYIHAIYIPIVAAQRDNVAGRTAVSDLLGGQTLLLSVAMAIGFAVVGPILAPFLFGARFAQDPLLVGLIGMLQAFRFLLSWPTTVALSLGRSVTVLVSNLAHMFAFVGGGIGLIVIGGLVGVVAGFVVGEAIATGVAIAKLNVDMALKPTRGFDKLAAMIALMAIVVAGDWAWKLKQWPAAAMVGAAGTMLVAWLIYREAAALRDAIQVARRAVTRRGPRCTRP